jgi:chromosomal replication initiation ATPase DnaA
MNTATTALIPLSPANDTGPERPAAGRYAQYAELFERILRETRDIEVALEVYESLRSQETSIRPPRVELAKLVAQVSAGYFGLDVQVLYLKSRRADIVAARQVASWILDRRHWKSTVIAEHFRQDHSTVLSSIKRVASQKDLLMAAHAVEEILRRELEKVATLATVLAVDFAGSSR